VNFCNISNLLLTTMSLLAISVWLVLLDHNLSCYVTRLPLVIYEYSFLCLWSGVFLFSAGLCSHCWVNCKPTIFSIITFRSAPYEMPNNYATHMCRLYLTQNKVIHNITLAYLVSNVCYSLSVQHKVRKKWHTVWLMPLKILLYPTILINRL